MAANAPENDKGLLPPDEVEQLFRRLSEALPGRTADAKGPKGQPTVFRSTIACLLSAQSQDHRTKQAVENLFDLAETPETMLELDDDQLIDAIRPAGLYNMKAKRIRDLCRTLIDDYGSVVPKERTELMKLPGIGRKCTDIILAFVYDEHVIAVDTHVHRVCNRTGLAEGRTEAKTAQSLDERAPAWAKDEGHFWLIQHGKRTCTSRSPRCGDCVVNDLCLAVSD